MSHFHHSGYFVGEFQRHLAFGLPYGMEQETANQRQIEQFPSAASPVVQRDKQHTTQLTESKFMRNEFALQPDADNAI